MSDKAKSAISWVAIVGLCFSVIGGAWIAGSALVAAGQILHEIRGLESAVIKLESKLENDTREMRQSIIEMKAKHDELEHRVDLIERVDGHKFNGYERTK
jgi:hypothetical protein